MAEINQITKVRLPDGEEVAIVDWSHRQLYSTAYFQNDFTDIEVSLFTYVGGDQVAASNNVPSAQIPTATLQHTNISQPGSMDATEECLVYGMANETYLSATFTDSLADFFGANGKPMLNAALQSYLNYRLVMELEVSLKAFYQAPLGWWSAGFGPSVSAVAATTAAAASTWLSASNNGLPSHEARWMSQIPVHIGGTEKFRVIIHNPGGNAVQFPLDTGVAQANTQLLAVRTIFDCLHKRATA